MAVPVLAVTVPPFICTSMPLDEAAIASPDPVFLTVAVPLTVTLESVVLIMTVPYFPGADRVPPDISTVAFAPSAHMA